MKNFAASPCCHVVIMYVCLGTCTLILHLINSNLLFNRLFPLYELILIVSFRHKQQFLLCKSYIWWTFSYDAPSYFWNKVVPFNFPVFFRQFCIICIIFMGKGFGVVVESIFDQLFYNFKINFVIVVWFGRIYFFLVNYIWPQTFPA